MGTLSSSTTIWARHIGPCGTSSSRMLPRGTNRERLRESRAEGIPPSSAPIYIYIYVYVCVREKRKGTQKAADHRKRSITLIRRGKGGVHVIVAPIFLKQTPGEPLPI